MSDTRITGSVGLDITNFRSNISELNRQIRVIETGFQAAGAGMDDWGKSEEGLRAKLESLTQVTELQRQKVENLSQQYQQVAAEKGENSKAAQDLLVKLNRETASLNENQSELNKTEAELKNYGKETKEAEEKSGRFSAALEGVAKAAAGMTLAVGAAATAAVAGLAKMTTGTAKASDDLKTLSDVTGVSTTKLQELQYAAELVDTDVDTITKSMRRNIQSMSLAREGTGRAAEAYEKIGVSVTDAAGNLRDSEEVFWEVIDAMGELENETERDAIALELLGRQGMELNPLIKAGSAQIEELAKKAHEVGYVMSEETIDSFLELSDQMEFMKANAQGAKQALGMILLPTLKELSTTGADMLGIFTKAVSEANGDITKIGEALGDVVYEITNQILQQLPDLIEVGMNIVTSITDAIMNNFPLIIDSGMQIVYVLMDAIIQYLPMLIEAGIQIVGRLAASLSEYLPQLIPAAVQMVVTIVQSIVDNIPLLIDSAIQLILGLIEGIIEALPVLIEAMPQLVRAIVDGIIQAIPQLIDAAIQLVMMLVEYLTDPDNIIILIKASLEIMEAIVTGLIRAIPELIKGAGNIVKSLVDVFRNTDWLGLGRDIIRGVAEGLKNAGKLIANTLKNIVSNAWDGVLNFLGIRSPSRLMRDTVGMPIGQGVAVGIEDSQKQVSAAMNSLANVMIIDPPEVKMNKSATRTAETATRPLESSVNFVQNNYSPKALSAYEIYVNGQKQIRDLKLAMGEV